LRINIANGGGINNAPNAVAGASQTVASGASVTLDGSASNDPDGDALSYQWAQIAGDAVTLGNGSSATASFTAPTVTSDRILRFELTVADNGGLDNKSTTSVTVRKTVGGKTGGSGGGSLGWLMLAVLAALSQLSIPRRGEKPLPQVLLKNCGSSFSRDFTQTGGV
jgi:hypothetical protein